MGAELALCPHMAQRSRSACDRSQARRWRSSCRAIERCRLPSTRPVECEKANGGLADLAGDDAGKIAVALRTLGKMSASNSPVVIASRRRSNPCPGRGGGIDCFVAALLAMTVPMAKETAEAGSSSTSAIFDETEAPSSLRAKRSNPSAATAALRSLDCFVPPGSLTRGSLLAMTTQHGRKPP